MAKIVFIGDSVTLGIGYGGVTVSNRYSTLIGRAAGYADIDIINSGVGGNNSADVLDRLQADVILHSPSVCVVMVGNNDYSGTGKVLTPAQYASNVTSIVVQLRAAGIKPVLFSPMLSTGSTASFVSWNLFLKALEQVAGDLKVPYLDIFREISFANLRGELPSLYVDTVHPSVAGHSLIAEYAMRSKHSGFFTNDSTTVPETPVQEESILLLTLAMADLLLTTVNTSLTTSIQSERDKFE